MSLLYIITKTNEPLSRVHGILKISFIHSFIYFLVAIQSKMIAIPRADVDHDRLAKESARLIVNLELVVERKSKRVGAVLTTGAMTRIWRVETKVPSRKNKWNLEKKVSRRKRLRKNLE